MTDPKYAAEEWARVARDPLRANDTDAEPWLDHSARAQSGTLAALCLLAALLILAAAVAWKVVTR